MTRWEKLHEDAAKLLPAIALAGLVFGLDLLERFGNAVGVLYIAPVLMVGLGAFRLKPHLIAIAGVCSALTVIGFALSSDAAVVGVGAVNRVLSLLAVWLATSLCLLYLRVEDSVSAVPGLLPICASCKKIRDGRGLWHHPESYFAEQFAVTFTHGICPDCTRQLYPEVVKKHLHYSSNVATRRSSTPKPAPDSLAG